MINTINVIFSFLFVIGIFILLGINDALHKYNYGRPMPKGIYSIIVIICVILDYFL